MIVTFLKEYMLKLTIGENTVCLNAKEEDVFFELLDQNYSVIKNSPTLNAIYYWMKELGHDRKTPVEEVEDPWNNESYKDAAAKLRELMASVLDNGYYLAS